MLFEKRGPYKRQRKSATASVVRVAATGAFAQIDSKPSIADLEPRSLPEPARASTSKVSGQFANNVEESSRPAIPFATKKLDKIVLMNLFYLNRSRFGSISKLFENLVNI